MTTSMKRDGVEIREALDTLVSDLDVFIKCHIMRGSETDEENRLGLTARLPETECIYAGHNGHRCILDSSRPHVVFNEGGEQVEVLHQSIRTIVHSLLEANRKLAKLASRDSLTGAHNRAFFNEAVQLEIAKANREGGHIMFIMIDIDHFKQINDTEGHQRGDELLTQVANILKANVRASDLVIRYGGDEFLVVAPRTGCDQTCEPILGRFQEAEHGQALGGLSLSMGCATWAPGEDVQYAIELADQRMYEHKRSKKMLAVNS